MQAYCKKSWKRGFILLIMPLAQAVAADLNPLTFYKPELWHDLSLYLPAGSLPLHLASSIQIPPARFPAVTAFAEYAGADAVFHANANWLTWQSTYHTAFTSLKPEWFSLLLPLGRVGAALFAFHPWESRAYQLSDTFLQEDILWSRTQWKESETFMTKTSIALRIMKKMAVSAGIGYVFGTEFDTIAYRKLSPITLAYKEKVFRTKNSLTMEGAITLTSKRIAVAMTGFYAPGWRINADSLIIVEKSTLATHDTLLSATSRRELQAKQAGGGVALSYTHERVGAHASYFLFYLTGEVAHEASISATFSPKAPILEPASSENTVYSASLRGIYASSWRQLTAHISVILPLKEKFNYLSTAVYYSHTKAYSSHLNSFGIMLGFHFRGKWFERIKIE